MSEDVSKQISESLRAIAGRGNSPQPKPAARAPADEFEEVAAEYGARSIRGVGAMLRNGESIRDLLRNDPEMFDRGGSGDGGKGNDPKTEQPSISALFHRYVKGA